VKFEVVVEQIVSTRYRIENENALDATQVWDAVEVGKPGETF
jgi:hypothetical protein